MEYVTFFTWYNVVYSIIRYIDAERFILKKQSGLCRLSKKKFNKTDMIVSAGQIHKKYYRKECAERLNII